MRVRLKPRSRQFSTVSPGWGSIMTCEVFYQHARADRHREAVDQLLAAGKAYYCYASQDELTAMREQAAPKSALCAMTGARRDRDPREAPDGVKPVVRPQGATAG